MINIVGAGFAGVECAWTLATHGVECILWEMRPRRMTPAHTTDYFAELVCSNSLKSKLPTSPAGQLKSEMFALGSLVLETALQHEVPAGEALGVDRNTFGVAITTAVTNHPLIHIRREVFTPQDADEILALGHLLVLATGPLTSPEMADWLAQKAGRQHLYFYDAVSPTVDASSLNRDIVFAQSRYDKGDGDDYLNCPFDKDSYEKFVSELISAERAPIHAFEAGGNRNDVPLPEGYESETPTESSAEEQFLQKIKYFAGCMPIEAIAEKGARSLAFGNFKPVGLTDPRTGRRPWAALQLRPENKEKTLYSLVACQTRLKWGEQKRVFQLVPGLESAEFVRYGVIHRNTYIEAPQLLSNTLSFLTEPNLYVSGQLTGVEGYVESAAMGIYTAYQILARLKGNIAPEPGRACAYGSLISHLMDRTEREFAPMNINWGLFPDPEPLIKDKGARKIKKIENAQTAFSAWIQQVQAASS